MDASAATDLLRLAAILFAGPTEESLLALTRERGWIDAQGHLTDAGRAVCAAFADQSGTRSVFRNLG